jgi:peptidoglycan/LPS O-acetylase OafA/YrhL
VEPGDEEQFYVVWPVVVALIAWRSRNAQRSIIICCVVASVMSLG